MSIGDPDFLTNPAKQLAAVEDLASLRGRLVELQTEVLRRMHERRALIQRLADEDMKRQEKRSGRMGSDLAMKRARASDDVRRFDEDKRKLTEQIQRLKIEIERYRLSIRVAVSARMTTAEGGFGPMQPNAGTEKE